MRISTMLLAAASVAALAVGAAHADVITLDVTAYTDGRDFLVIQGDQLYWDHLDFAAPGRLDGVNFPTVIKTTFDGAPVQDVSWTPTWPLPPPDPIRFHANSSVLDWLPGAPISGLSFASLGVIQARDSLTLFQQPSAANGYTTILDFNDDPAAGAAYYEGVVTWQTGALTPIPAVATLSSHTVNFGTVRAKTPNVTGNTTVTNTATGFPVDNLNVTSATGLPTNVSVNGALPTGLASGQSGDIGFLLDTSNPGVVGGSATLGFTSTSTAESLVLPNQQVNFTGTVTQVADPLLLKDSGAGVFSGSGTSFLLDLGSIRRGTGSLVIDLGVLNDIANTSYSETLAGSFQLGKGKGYSFSGAEFFDLAGGDTDTGNLLNFNPDVKAGAYTDTLTFYSLSSYPGLPYQYLSPITLTITANVFGGVPELSTWAMMLVGLGGLGAMMRARRQTGREPALA